MHLDVLVYGFGMQVRRSHTVVANISCFGKNGNFVHSCNITPELMYFFSIKELSCLTAILSLETCFQQTRNICEHQAQFPHQERAEASGSQQICCQTGNLLGTNYHKTVHFKLENEIQVQISPDKNKLQRRNQTDDDNYKPFASPMICQSRFVSFKAASTEVHLIRYVLHANSNISLL